MRFSIALYHFLIAISVADPLTISDDLMFPTHGQSLIVREKGIDEPRLVLRPRAPVQRPISPRDRSMSPHRGASPPAIAPSSTGRVRSTVATVDTRNSQPQFTREHRTSTQSEHRSSRSRSSASPDFRSNTSPGRGIALSQEITRQARGNQQNSRIGRTGRQDAARNPGPSDTFRSSASLEASINRTLMGFARPASGTTGPSTRHHFDSQPPELRSDSPSRIGGMNHGTYEGTVRGGMPRGQVPNGGDVSSPQESFSLDSSSTLRSNPEQSLSPSRSPRTFDTIGSQSNGYHK